MTQRAQRSWWRVAVGGLGAALLALSANLAIGPLLSDDDRLRTGFEGSLDYSGLFPPGVPPLTDAFVESRLGLSPDRAETRATRSTTRDSSDMPRPATFGRTLLEHRLTNDNFADALTVPALPFTARTFDEDASREPGEPTRCASDARTVWYRYRPSRDIGLFANTFGSVSATAIGVFRGDRVDDLEQMRCNASSSGDAHVAFAATRGTTYYFQVAHGDAGRLVFSLDALGTTTRASLSSDGRELDDASGGASISGDGRFVAFTSFAGDVTTTDGDNRCSYRPVVLITAPECADVYVRDLRRDRTVHASVSNDGVGGNDLSAIASLSASGRYVTFASWATNLVPGDTNGQPDIFLRDLKEKRTERVSLASDGRQGSALAIDRPLGYAIYDAGNLSEVTPDGRYVAFSTALNGLVDGDEDGVRDVFVRDRRTGRTEKLSWSSGGRPANDDSFAPSISADGRFVAFESFAGNLVEGDSNRCGPTSCIDVFLFDRRTKRLRRVSVSSAGEQADNHSAHPAISEDGRYIAFASTASTLVDRSPLDDPVSEDIFVHDRLRRTTRRVSVSTGGQPQRGSPETFHPAPSKDPPISRPGISGDGRYIAFASRAANLGPGDDGTIIDIFVHDVQTGATVGASVSSAGTFANGNSWNVTLSRAGTAVAFTSEASNLVRDDTNRCVDSQSTTSCFDVFVHRFSRAR